MEEHFLDIEDSFTTNTDSASNHSSSGFLINNDEADLADLLQLENDSSTKPVNDPLLPYAASTAHFDPLNIHNIPKPSWSELTEWSNVIPSEPDRFTDVPTTINTTTYQPFLSLTEHQPTSLSMFRKAERRSAGEASAQLYYHGHVRPPAKCSNVGFQNPIPREGRLELTEEERRTLIAEGLMLPEELPLSQEEEQILKRIRRKIKNKISAQDSRRRRKEYIEALEAELQLSNCVNAELTLRLKKMEEMNHRLTLQLRNQSRVLSGPLSVYSAQNGDFIRSNSIGSTCLKLLVLCCAVFLVHDRSESGHILSGSTSMTESGPGLPWVSTVMIVPSWRWSPARHLHLGGTQGSPYGEYEQENSSVVLGPKVIMSYIGDGRSRLIIDDEDDLPSKKYGPRYLLLNPGYEAATLQVSDFEPHRRVKEEVDQNTSLYTNYHWVMDHCH